MEETITLELTVTEILRLIAALHQLIDSQAGPDQRMLDSDKALLLKLIEVAR